MRFYFFIPLLILDSTVQVRNPVLGAVPKKVTFSIAFQIMKIWTLTYGRFLKPKETMSSVVSCMICNFIIVYLYNRIICDYCVICVSVLYSRYTDVSRQECGCGVFTLADCKRDTWYRKYLIIYSLNIKYAWYSTYLIQGKVYAWSLWKKCISRMSIKSGLDTHLL